MSRRTYSSSSGYTSAGQAECPTCRSLSKENERLHEKIGQYQEIIKARDDEYQLNLHRNGEMEKKIRRLQLEMTGLQRDNTQLHQELHASEDKYQSNLHRSGEMRKKIKRLELEVSQLQADLFKSEKKVVEESAIQKEKDTKHKQKTRKLKHEITKLKEDIQQLREMVSKAFRRCHLSIRIIQAVVIEDIETDRVNAWFDFLNPLELSLEDIDRKDMSLNDARWNVNCVMSKWLNGCGSSPKTWGTLLDAMHGGSQFLRQLATRTEFKLLEGLACLDFQLCPSCREKFANKEQEKMTFTEEKPRLPFPVEDTSPRIRPAKKSSHHESDTNVHCPPPP